MPTLTVSADDSATAMEEIVQKLGENSYILSTKKTGGKIHIKATNDIKPEGGRPALKQKKDFQNALTRADSNLAPVNIAKNDMVLESNIVSMSNSAETKNIRSEAARVKNSGKNSNGDYSASIGELEKLETRLNKITHMLDGMILTRRDEAELGIGRNSYIAMQQAGFSSELVSSLRDTLNIRNEKLGCKSFLRELSERLILTDPASLMEQKHIFVVGPAGSGKSSLAAKLAVKRREMSMDASIRLIEIDQPGVTPCDGLKYHGRLLNMQINKITPESAPEEYIDSTAPTITDICINPHEIPAVLDTLEKKLGSENMTVLIALPGGASARLIRQQCMLFKSFNPVIALTRLDECETGPEEFSVLAEMGMKIGVFTGTRGLVDSIIFASMPALAQYLEDYCT
jgi:flagellar biosynthesis protein FlhF